MTALVPFQDNPIMSNTNLKPTVSSGALTLIQSKTAKEYPRVNYNGTEMALSTFVKKGGLGLKEIGDLNPEALGYVQQYNAQTKAKHTQKLKEEKMAKATVPSLKRSQSDEDVMATDVSRVSASKVAEQIEKREHRAKSALQEHNDRMKQRTQGGGSSSMSQMKQGGGFG